MYKPILEALTTEFNKTYKEINKKTPYYPLREKQQMAIEIMAKKRKDFIDTHGSGKYGSLIAQYTAEIIAVEVDTIKNELTRYYLEDDSLFDFFKETELKQKEIDRICEALKKNANSYTAFGMLGKTFSCTVVLNNSSNKCFMSVLTPEMNYTFVPSEIDLKRQSDHTMFNMVMNFMLYQEAFPEKIIDGVPNGVKRTLNSQSVKISEKIILPGEHEHKGFVKPHYRSGYFMHFKAERYVNVRGQTRFVAGKFIRGKAKTVLE